MDSQQYLKGKPFESFTGDANSEIAPSIPGAPQLYLQPQPKGHQTLRVLWTAKAPHSISSISSISTPGSFGTPFPGQPGSLCTFQGWVPWRNHSVGS